MKTTLSTPHAPAAVGPYAQAVKANGFVFCSGQIGIDPITNTFNPNADVRLQTEQIMKNLDAVLAEAGSDWDKIVRTEIFLTNMDDYATVNEIYARYFEAINAPARQCVAVKTLPLHAKVEISVIALAE